MPQINPLDILGNPFAGEYRPTNVGTVVEIVDEVDFVVLVQTEDKGRISMVMATEDEVKVDDKIFVIQLPGGNVVGLSAKATGLPENFLETNKCSNISFVK